MVKSGFGDVVKPIMDDLKPSNPRSQKPRCRPSTLSPGSRRRPCGRDLPRLDQALELKATRLKGSGFSV